MAGVRARASARSIRKETEPLDLQQAPRREDVTVARLRIVPVGGNRSGATRAARSGGTLQINCTVQPAHHDAHAQHAAPDVVYARPVWTAPSGPSGQVAAPESWPRARTERAAFSAVPTTVIPAPGQNLADLQMRAVRALVGVQSGLNALQAQGIDLRKWSKSSMAWTAAVGAYAVVLFLIAILTS